jgi:CRISPR-associated protein (TIGR03986 family)
MDIPEHVTPSINGRQGKAPYNFVPLPEAIFEAPGGRFDAHNWLNPERLHGFIDLDITTETELYTRSAYPPEEESKDVQRSRPRQAFYHHGDEDRPVIPGSSLRGMVRSLVEILSYSRITRRPTPEKALRIRDERLVHRAVADQQTPTGQAYNKRFLKEIKPKQLHYPSPQVQAGYLEKNASTGGWQIRPALKVQGTSFVRVGLDTLGRNRFPGGENEVRDVWVKPSPVKSYPHRSGLTLWYARTDDLGDSAASGSVRGVLVYSGPIASRHMHTVIYAPDGKAPPIPIPEEMWERFCEDRDQQRGIACRKIRADGDPLFYLLDGTGKLEFFGPTLFFRLPYPYCTGDYAPQATVDPDGPLDLAESIFGTVNGEAQGDKPHTGAHKGRVQFGDASLSATPDSGSPFLEGQDGIRWPSVLSAPKPTSYQNYLVQRDPEGKRENLLSYSSRPIDVSDKGEATVLRGFKLYWHRGSAAPDLHLQPLTKHLKQYTVIRPVKPQVSFRGRLRFENLRPLELGALLAALELPGDLRHHLGMGKPLGMGSVEIRATTTLIDPVERYRSLAAHGRADPAAQDRKLEEAREAFRSEIVAHHNAHARDALRLAPSTGLLEIPRLQALGCLLDWQHQPLRHKTDYIRDLKTFRARQVLPTPAAVLGRPEPEPEPAALRMPDRPHPNSPSDIITETPVLKELQTLLQDTARTQRQRLEAIDETLRAQLEALADEQRRCAWDMIRWSIGVNKKTRDRLQALEQRLRRNRI